MSPHDAIFALATPATPAALHLHRLSGAGIIARLSPYTRSVRTRAPLDLIKRLDAHHASRQACVQHALLVDAKGEPIDEVLLTLFRGPYSFTGEDVVEISCHGNPLIDAHLQSLLRSLDFREALPGEFTQRAVLHGKIDLAQAEGIHDLVCAETWGAVTLAHQQLQGILSDKTQELRTQLIGLSAYLEAHIDFAPDEVGSYEPQTLAKPLHEISSQLEELLASYSTGKRKREGVRVVLCGPPNAGKSSLYNALLQEERAIVTPIAGTTRDVLIERLFIENRDFILMDTAGIRDTEDVVEHMGIERSHASLSTADALCVLMDVTSVESYAARFEAFLHFYTPTSAQKVCVVLTKNDLLSASRTHAPSPQDLLPDADFLAALAQKQIPTAFVAPGQLESLKSVLVRFYDALCSLGGSSHTPATLTSMRQKDKVHKALSFLKEAEELVAQGDFPEKISSTLHLAQHELREIVGEIGNEQVYESIFSSFCIGK